MYVKVLMYIQVEDEDELCIFTTPGLNMVGNRKNCKVRIV